jgi:hypothetical protein
MFTSHYPVNSCDDGEIERCYQVGANSYIRKPDHLDELLEMADHLVKYWSGCAIRSNRRFAAVAR